VHGNEIAGSRAAEALRELKVVKGTMIIVPRVNTRALEAGVRTLPEIGDINRAYPGSVIGTPAERIASDISFLIKQYRVSMVIDLHEARNFNRADPSSLGQTIEYADNDKSALLALAAVEHINKTIRDPLARFTFLAHPIKGSGAHYAGQQGLIAFTLETSIKQALADRVNQHLELVRFMLKEEGIIR
jgi:predicted deacylase